MQIRPNFIFCCSVASAADSNPTMEEDGRGRSVCHDGRSADATCDWLAGRVAGWPIGWRRPRRPPPSGAEISLKFAKQQRTPTDALRQDKKHILLKFKGTLTDPAAKLDRQTD